MASAGPSTVAKSSAKTADDTFRQQARTKQTALTAFGVQVTKAPLRRKKRKCTIAPAGAAPCNDAADPVLLYGVEVPGNDAYSDPNDSDFEPIESVDESCGTLQSDEEDEEPEEALEEDEEVVLVDVVAPDNVISSGSKGSGSKGSSKTAKSSAKGSSKPVADDDEDDCCLFRPILFRKWCSEFRWLKLRYAASNAEVPREEWEALEGTDVCSAIALLLVVVACFASFALICIMSTTVLPFHGLD